MQGGYGVAVSHGASQAESRRRTAQRGHLSTWAHLGLADLLALFLPLTFSSVLMSFGQQLVNAGIARLPRPELSLAAYGVVLSVSVFIEAPIIVMLHAANALVRDPASYHRVFRFMVGIGLALSLLHALVAATPLYGVVFEGWIGLSPEVASAARTGFLLMTPWSFAIAWRRFFQGVAVGHGATHLVGWGTVVRFATVLLGMGAALAAGQVPGVTAGGATLSLSVIVEAVVVTWLARPVVEGYYRGGAARPVEDRTAGTDGRDPAVPELTWGDLLRFYWPLCATSLVGRLVPPMFAAVIARAPHPETNLAAWPIAWGLAMLFGVSTQMLSQLVIPVVGNPAHLATAMRFAHLVGMVLALLLVLVTWTPVGALYFTYLISAPPHVVAAAIPAARVLAVLPLLQAAQNAMHGLYSGTRRTRQLFVGMVINLAATASASLVLVWVGAWSGAVVAAAAMACGVAVELGFLRAARPDRAWAVSANGG